MLLRRHKKNVSDIEPKTVANSEKSLNREEEKKNGTPKRGKRKA